MNQVEVYYRYNDLDKTHEYQIENEQDIQNQWVWFYIGKYLKQLKKDEWIYPYEYQHKKRLGIYKVNSAKERAKLIVKAIEKHRLNRKIK